MDGVKWSARRNNK